jgi:hypothetical protein
MNKDTDRQRVLLIEWAVPGLPRLVGPFPNDAEAARWARMNVPNGSWTISQLARPYAEAAR